MKKFLIFLFISVGFFAISQNYTISQDQNKFDVATIMDDTVRSTESCTTSTFTARPIQSYNVWAWDRSEDDSANVIIYFDFCTDPTTLQDWVVVDSFTYLFADDDSVWKPFILTEFAVPSFPYQRLRATGLSDNKIDTCTAIKVRKSLVFEIK